MLVSQRGFQFNDVGSFPCTLLSQNADQSVHMICDERDVLNYITERIAILVEAIFLTIETCDFFLSNIYVRAHWKSFWMGKEIMILFTPEHQVLPLSFNARTIRNIREVWEELPSSYFQHKFPGFGFHEYLFIDNMRLRFLPETIGNWNQVTAIFASNNQLSSLPVSLSNLNNLRVLYLMNNHFQIVPEVLYTLPATCYVILTGNPLTAESIQQLITRTSDPSYHGPRITFSMEGAEGPQAPVEPLETTLPEWCADETCRKSLLTECSEEQQYWLSAWFGKLKISSDYNSKITKPRLQSNVQDILKWIATEKDHDEVIFAHGLIHGGTESCGDAAVIAINELTMRRKFAEAYGANQDWKSLRDLVISYRRYNLVRERANTKCMTIRGAIDPIEVYLHFEVELRKELNLPVETMLYQACSNVTEADIKEARESILKETAEPCHLEILSNNSLWQKEIARRHPEFESYLAKFNHDMEPTRTAALEGWEKEGLTPAQIKVQVEAKERNEWNPYRKYTQNILSII